MAKFESSFKRMLNDEGVVLTNDPHDRGKQTFCGISRKSHPSWIGWKDIDRGETPSLDLVRFFYNENFWQPIRADEITSQAVAEGLFGQHVNMGANAIKLMQQCLELVADGKVGPKTIAAINATPEETLLMRYALANVARYHAIGMKDKTQRKFWPGWLTRAIAIVKEAK